MEQISQLRRAKGVLPGVTTRAKGRASFAHLVWLSGQKSVYGAYNPGSQYIFIGVGKVVNLQYIGQDINHLRARWILNIYLWQVLLGMALVAIGL